MILNTPSDFNLTPEEVEAKKRREAKSPYEYISAQSWGVAGTTNSKIPVKR